MVARAPAPTRNARVDEIKAQTLERHITDAAQSAVTG